MRLEYLLLEETIKKTCKNGPVYYFANPGNWGDGLIRAGTLKFFRDFNIDYQELNLNKIEWILPLLKGGTVIYGGGGGWCEHYHHSYRQVKKLSKRFNVIVLPSSYDRDYSIPGVINFRRDHFQSKENMPESIFCHDMAFYLGNINSQKGNGTGYFFRKDPESSGKIQIPENNVDISTKGTHFSDMYSFFEELSQYEVIYTDRLHVAIASCLLNREVHIYSNAYFKVKAVFESSIKNHFENAHFHDDFTL